MELRINDKVIDLTRGFYVVKSTDRIEITLKLPARADSFVKRVEAQTCNPTQYQQQTQSIETKSEAFLRRTSELFAKKRSYGITTLNKNQSTQETKIYFKPSDITHCYKRDFYITIKVAEAYYSHVSSVRNFKSKLRFHLAM
jgi:hypothetical protein